MKLAAGRQLLNKMMQKHEFHIKLKSTHKAVFVETLPERHASAGIVFA